MTQELAPRQIGQAGPDTLRIEWSDGHVSLYPVRYLRLVCRCANCIDEHTGEPRLKPETVPHDVRPRRIQAVGRYALQFFWSDGHDTGIYTFEHLRSACPCCCTPDSDQPARGSSGGQEGGANA